MASSAVWKPGFADVIERFGDPLQQNLSKQGRKVFSQVQACRTSILGGQVLRCDKCHQHHLQYHSCRNRHCPRCGYQASQEWVNARAQDVLPVTYHHLVFTLPHELNPIVGQYKAQLYKLLFDAVWRTLKAFASDPRGLNGELGATLMLHTWGQTLIRHVHIHCLVPGGALQGNGLWRPAKSTYLFPVRALSRVYRGKMVASLRRSREFFEQIDDAQMDKLLDDLMSIEWNVYSKPVLAKPRTVVEYLGRYTKRIGLSNARLLKMDDTHVWLKYRDSRDEKGKIMKLAGEELLRRFLLHLLPRGFMRVRYYGYLANTHRRRKLMEIRQALDEEVVTTAQSENVTVQKGYVPICTKCDQQMVIVKVIRSILNQSVLTTRSGINTS